jgi:hypothetical protein
MRTTRGPPQTFLKRDAHGLHERCDGCVPICQRYCETEQFELKPTSFFGPSQESRFPEFVGE